MYIEDQYLTVLQDLLTQPRRQDRTGTGTRSIFGHTLVHKMADGFPLLTTKKVPLRLIYHELAWMLSGSTNIQYLLDKNVHIWDEWADEDGELGPVYGKQWRDFNGVDQIEGVLKSLTDNPYSRRHIVSAWNPAEVEDMNLPPCHMFFQLYVENCGGLSLQMYQRSADIFLGVPFNIASYAMLLMFFAIELHREPVSVRYVFGDLHLYTNHEEQALEQIKRPARPLPKLTIDQWDGMFETEYEHLILEGYDPHPTIKGEVSV